jgi:hypothetical protein
VDDARNGLLIKVGTLCKTLAGVDVPLVTVTNKISPTVISEFQKPVVVVIARQKPKDAASSTMVDGFVRKLC